MSRKLDSRQLMRTLAVTFLCRISMKLVRIMMVMALMEGLTIERKVNKRKLDFYEVDGEVDD